MKKDIPGEGKHRSTRGARAHRDDTPEAKTQRHRASKTHPNPRVQGAMRKDVASKAKAQRPRRSGEVRGTTTRASATM